ncbi:MAG: hypothetical protein J7K84_04375, partial [Deltaproteobacteria bacterium]|nr:hypothetical protein [Deltaproteobacteria bacterium]
RLEEIYAHMDEKYNKAAEYYGFTCTGCLDNCCLTRFYHHTLLEYFYIKKGFSNLNADIRSDGKTKALAVIELTAEADKNKETARVMCPLNLDGLCLIYPFRPMICRLHGISHELNIPGRGINRGPGCDDFMKLCNSKEYYKFDRTPFYIKMAALEKDLKETAGITKKIKMTIAEMIINW